MTHFTISCDKHHMSNWPHTVPNETAVQLCGPFSPEFDKETYSRGNYVGSFADPRDIKTGWLEAIFVIKFSPEERNSAGTC